MAFKSFVYLSIQIVKRYYFLPAECFNGNLF